MPTHPVAVRNSITDHVVDKLDAGSTNSTPRIVFKTVGDAVVATLNMDGTAAFGASASGIATAAAIADDTNAVGGIVTKCVLTDKDNTVIIEGTVATSGADINMSSTTISAGDTFRITALTYTAPA